jgi:IPT/TIG domain-containing protein
MPLQNVNPGDLIKSEDWNRLVAAINALDGRVAQLETGGSGRAPHITQVLPGGTVTAGDTINIFGSNFDFSQGGHSVFFGNTRAVTFFNGSSDTLLIVRIPDVVEGATPTGAPLTLTVGNLVDTTSQAIVIKSKPVVIGGGIQFTFKGTRPTATPTAGAQFFYDFELKSQASDTLTVTVTPTIAVILPLPAGVSDPGLANLVTVMEGSTERPNGQISLAAGATKTVTLRLSVPAATNGLRYSLSLAASAPGVSTRVESLPPQQVGQATEQPDPTITIFEFATIADGDAAFSTNTGGVTGVDGTISVRQSNSAVIELRATFANIPAGQTNNYAIAAAIDGPAGGWSTKPDTVMQNPLPVPGPGGPVPIFIDVTAPGAPATAILRVTLTRQGISTNNKRSVAYRLTLR